MNDKKKKNIIKSMILGSVIGILIGSVGLVTYAMFTYNSSSTNSGLLVGDIYFRSQENDTINLTNASPITRTQAATNTINTDDLEIAITGNTTYSGGVEYLITATDVNNTVGNKTIPISIIATASNLGTSNDSYYSNRGGNSSIYKVIANETISENDKLLVGYIKSGSTGINGTLTIKAFLDYDLIIISDSYTLTQSDINAGKVVLTTSEWNSIKGNNALSFKVKVEAKEGTWVEEPVTLTASQMLIANADTIGLENQAGAYRYVGTDPDNFVLFNNEQWRIIGVYGDKLKIVKATPSITSQTYNSSSSSNAWVGSTLQATYLYNTYWNDNTKLSATAKTMIEENASWNVGACGNDVVAADAYSCASATTWNGKVGLIANYEYLYGASTECWETSGYDYDGGCTGFDWLYNVLVGNSGTLAWFLNSDVDNSSKALALHQNGGYVQGYDVTGNGYVSPVVYMKSDVTISGGDGKSGSEYTLSCTTCS